MKIWHCNWASVQDVECLMDDGMDTEDLANPNGVLLRDIKDLHKVRAMVEQEDKETFGDDGWEPESWTTIKDHAEYRSYHYGEETLLICTLKEVL
jgi:hypothetical protein